MARRIEIELTSERGDGTWTWRAAGARQPKGQLAADLLPSEAKVGDVLRAEIEGFLGGEDVVAVFAPKPQRSEPDRIELLTPHRESSLVTTQVSRQPREGRDRKRRDRRDRPEREGRRRPRSEQNRERGPDRPRRERPPADAKPKPKRLRPHKTHRNALLESLPVEQRPIAEQLLQGGIPAVRQAIEKQNETLKAEDKPVIKAEPLLEIADKLRHRAQAAVWRDRADAALAHVDDVDLRDLRSVVNAASDAGRDTESREMASKLREALIARVDKEQAAWVDEVAENIREGRVVRALRLSSRPPKAGSPVPGELSEQLIQATSAALTSEVGPQRWATVLDALAYSPIRRRVVPESLPTKLNDELRGVISKLADRLPEIAHIFDIKPKPTPPRERKRGGRKRPASQNGTAAKGDKSKNDKPKGEKPKGEKPKGEKPKGEKPKDVSAEKDRQDDEPTGVQKAEPSNDAEPGKSAEPEAAVDSKNDESAEPETAVERESAEPEKEPSVSAPES